MGKLGPSEQRQPPLQVFLMAVALAAAAFGGAALGYVIDFFGSDDEAAATDAEGDAADDAEDGESS